MTSTAGAVASREVFVFVNVDFLNRDEEPGLGNVACECPLFNLPAAAIRRRIRQLGVEGLNRSRGRVAPLGGLLMDEV